VHLLRKVETWKGSDVSTHLQSTCGQLHQMRLQRLSNFFPDRTAEIGAYAKTAQELQRQVQVRLLWNVSRTNIL